MLHNIIMFNIVLYQPEIPPNTGNIIRLAANMGATLHLIEPLGFELNDKQLRRAGLDYVLDMPLKRYENFEAFLKAEVSLKLYLCSTKATQLYCDATYTSNDAFVFGPETRGLPTSLLESYPEEQKIRIPMVPNSRSLNLSNSVAIILYEAWRQQNFMIKS
jgi:tRNA (cytidine/uridine-2'-O-)-methyltransferase